METDSKNIKVYDIECSPSYIINNLSISEDSLYFIHNSQSFPRILVINKKLIKEQANNKVLSVLNSSEKNEMLFVKSLFINDTEYIAVGLYSGFKLWNKEGSKLLFQITNPNPNKNKIYSFISCAPFLQHQENKNKNVADCILSADNYGQLHLIYGAKSNWKNSQIFSNPNNESILSIGSNLGTNKIGITLDNGDILILKIENNSCNQEKRYEGDNQNIAINSVIFSDNDKNEFFLGCGFINGLIKIYSLNNYNLKFSINSNLRSVGPMIIKGNNEIITGSDDGQITIWKYDDKNDKMTLEKNILFEDKMIVGLAYDKQDNNLYISCYDCPAIISVSDI